MLNIISNGSKWAGEAPDTLEKLLEVLSGYALDRRFEEYGNFIIDSDGPTRFFGNFFELSHVFSIDTDEPEIIGRLTTAIRENQQRPDYLNQQDPGEARLEAAQREEAAHQARIAKHRAAARRYLDETS